MFSFLFIYLYNIIPNHLWNFCPNKLFEILAYSSWFFLTPHSAHTISTVSSYLVGFAVGWIESITDQAYHNLSTRDLILILINIFWNNKLYSSIWSEWWKDIHWKVPMICIWYIHNNFKYMVSNIYCKLTDSRMVRINTGHVSLLII